MCLCDASRQDVSSLLRLAIARRNCILRNGGWRKRECCLSRNYAYGRPELQSTVCGNQVEGSISTDGYLVIACEIYVKSGRTGSRTSTTTCVGAPRAGAPGIASR